MELGGSSTTTEAFDTETKVIDVRSTNRLLMGGAS